MSARWARRTVGLLVVVVLGLEVAAVCLSIGVAPLAPPVLYLVYAVTQAGAGALVVHRYPRHPIGWLLVDFSLLNALASDLGLAYGMHGVGAGWPAAATMQVVALTTWIVAAAGLILLFLLFPDGILPGRRWAGVGWLWAVGAALAVPGWALDPALGEQLVGGVNPLAVTGLPHAALFGAGAGLICVALLLSILALVLRLRRSRGVERDQLKWFALAAAVVGLVLPLAAALWTVWEPIQLLAAIALVLLPVSASFAILRHRLYDVDLVITRTIAFAVLAIVLAGVYVSVALIAAEVLASPAAAALAALVVALTFGTVHDRVQGTADRWLRPARHRATAAMAAYVEALRRGDTAEHLDGALRRCLSDEHVALALELRDGSVVDPAGHRVARPVPTTERDVLMIPTGSEATALLTHRREDARLAAAVAAAGRLAVEVTALQVQLRRQLRELEASRARIQSVADEERRRIARDLHDGAQQRLIAIGLALRHAQLRLADDGPSMSRALDEAVAELASSVDELRELAGGLRPRSLDDGLAGALAELAARTPTRLELIAVDERFPRHLETAAYFVASEAVTNAVKHAEASCIAVRVARVGTSLVVSIADDGRGGAVPGRGSGLLGLADRVRAHHGEWTVHSPQGGGTRVEVWLPCE